MGITKNSLVYLLSYGVFGVVKSYFKLIDIPNPHTQYNIITEEGLLLVPMDGLDTDDGRLCNYCEEYIIEGSGNCSTFRCEGIYCEDAKELILSDILDN